MSFSPSHTPTYPSAPVVAQQPMSRQSMTLERDDKSAPTHQQQAQAQEQTVDGPAGAMRLRGGCPGHFCGLPILPCKCDICIIPCCC